MRPTFFWVLPWIICASTAALCQVITGNIVGQITDASGASVPRVAVVIRDSGTGISVIVEGDDSGSYSAPDLRPGLYEISVRKEGFRIETVTGVQLLAQQTARLDFQLVVASVQQSIEVKAQGQLVHTDSQTIHSSINQRQLTDLPTTSRSIDGLLILLPGVTGFGNVSNISNPQISGSHYWGSTNFSLNGVSVNNFGNGSATGTHSFNEDQMGEANLPPPEALQEFRVDSGGLSAEYKNVAAVTLVLKQGTNNYHGDVYEYVEDDVLNANYFMLNATGQPKPSFNRNQFGGDVGGPIKKNGWFFFVSYRGIRERSSRIAKLELPSEAMRSGDFSTLCRTYDVNNLCSDSSGTQLYNPWTGQPFARNQIPSNLITAQARTLMSYLPALTIPSTALPNSAPNYIAPIPSRFGLNGLDARLDGQLSAKDSVHGTVHRSVGDPWSEATGATPAGYGNEGDRGYTHSSFSATETHMFSPTTVNEGRGAWTKWGQSNSGQNTDFNPQSLFPQLPVANNGGLPTMNVTGYTGMWTDGGLTYQYPQYTVQVSDNFSHVRGRHTFKFGGDVQTYRQNVRQGGPKLTAPLGNPLGTFNFSGRWTGNQGWSGQPHSQGNAFADFLLGTADSSNYGIAPTNIQISSRDWEFYAQDTWQATAKLTLNFGLRYKYQRPWHVRDDRVSYLDLTNNKLALPQDSPTVVPPPEAFPELLAAYPFETTQNAGWPKSYFVPTKKNFGPRLGFAYRPFPGNNTVLRGGWGIYYDNLIAWIGQYENMFNPPWQLGATYTTQLPGNPTAPFLPDITFANPFPAMAAGAPPANPLVYVADRHIRNPMQQQWNFTLEQQFAGNWMARATYVGSKTTHGLFYASDINKPNVQQPNVPPQQQVTYQPWSQVLYTYTGGYGHFNQLQLELLKRFSRGFQFQAQYNFTSSLDNTPIAGGPQNPWNATADYGNSDGLPRQTLVVNFVCDLPVGRGRPLLAESSLFVDAVLGGWSISGIGKYQTGAPSSVTFTVPGGYIGWQGGRADVVPGASVYAGQEHSHDVINGVQWFNTAAFAPPQPWQYGNSPRNMLFGPGLWNWDIGLRKSISVTKASKLQFRVDLFNAFNHANLDFGREYPQQGGGSTTVIADTRDGGLANPSSGKIFSAGTFPGPRVVQLGLKFEF
jgi:Carboxypeptidase regulatory-like domain